MRNIEAHLKKPESETILAVKRLVNRLLWGYNVDPYDYAPAIEEPVLIIASMEDTTIIHEASAKVADRLKNCEMITLTGIKHEELLCDTSYERISEFMVPWVKNHYKNSWY